MPQQPPHYTLIIRLPFPRPPNSAFDSIPQPPSHTLQQQNQNQDHQTRKPTPPTTTSKGTPPPQPSITKQPTAQPNPQQAPQQPQLPTPPNKAATSNPPPSAPPAAPTSEGTPSMGSSFSDLSGASVAQSALEEALMSDLRADGGGFGSRVSATGWEGRR